MLFPARGAGSGAWQGGQGVLRLPSTSQAWLAARRPCYPCLTDFSTCTLSMPSWWSIAPSEMMGLHASRGGVGVVVGRAGGRAGVWTGRGG